MFSHKPEDTRGDKDVALELLKVIRELLAETGTARVGESIALDDSLESDLGFDSLARVELVVRVEQHFGVSLPEQVFAEADTPRELLVALGQASGHRRTVAAEPLENVVLGEAEVAPRSAITLVDVLSWHVESHGERTHLQISSESADSESLTYRALWDGALEVAAGLQALGVIPGQAVALILPTGKDYFFSFFGVLLAGAIPVPIYPPARPGQMEDHLRRHIGILDNCRATVLIADSDTTRVANWLRSAVGSMKHLVTVTLLTARQAGYERPSINPESTAFIQYTSGSTGQPKGVVLSHANLLANIRAMGQWLNAGPDDVFVSWLPLYHDMGLIGAWLGSLYHATFFVVMSPMSFLVAPRRWLRTIQRYGGTLSAAPNFGYELCLHRIRDDELDGLDLCSWRVACNGAEAVSPTTLERFCRRFEPFGFNRGAMMPVYGLAENSVGLTMPATGRGPVIDCIDREVFSGTGRAVPSETDGYALRFAACGQSLPGHEIRIVDDNGRELPDRRQGRIQFRGPSATHGYCRNPEKTRELFDGDWLNTGDLGYTVNGELYVTGRIKDVVIRAGRNIYPEELEERVGDLAGIRKGRVAVFGSVDSRSGTERLVILAETRETDDAKLEALRKHINELALDCLEAPPDDIVMAPPGSLLKTSSGKIRRDAIRERYEKGEATETPPAVWRQWLQVQLMRAVPSMTVWRQRGVETAWAWYVWVWYGLLAPFVWLTLMVVPRLNWRWQLMRGIGRVFARVTFTPIVVRGGNNMPLDRPCVFVANHQSYLDPYVMVFLLPRPAGFVAKAELARKRSTGPPLRRMGCVFVERFDAARGSEDARTLSGMARQERSLVFFPEGTFSRIPGVRSFHMGAFVSAVEADLPVVPVTIRGTRHMLRADSWFPRRGRITVEIDEPVIPAEVRQSGETVWQTAVKLRDRTRETIVSRSGEPDLAAGPEP